ncbi:unnamed protein product [Auanema sp. JU1783]|nr:unnamed protein product [Auanema sp. JU1783]
MRRLIMLFIFILLIDYGYTLHCIQCDKHSGWYSEEEHEKHVEACQQAAIVPTKCQNASHTHCIVSWYRNGGESMRTVTERKCGGAEDITGCTLYNSKIVQKKVRRHLINRDTDFNQEQPNVMRESAVIFVEVCSESCAMGDCVNYSSTHILAFSYMLSLLAVIL